MPLRKAALGLDLAVASCFFLHVEMTGVNPVNPGGLGCTFAAQWSGKSLFPGSVAVELAAEFEDAIADLDVQTGEVQTHRWVICLV